MNVGLLVVAFWKALLAILNDVRRQPVWVPALMVVIVVIGTFLAQLVGH